MVNVTKGNPQVKDLGVGTHFDLEIHYLKAT